MAVPYSKNGPQSGGRFATMEDITSNATAELRGIPKEYFGPVEKNVSAKVLSVTARQRLVFPP
jgi:hypothetical protein